MWWCIWWNLLASIVHTNCLFWYANFERTIFIEGHSCCPSCWLVAIFLQWQEIQSKENQWHTIYFVARQDESSTSSRFPISFPQPQFLCCGLRSCEQNVSICNPPTFHHYITTFCQGSLFVSHSAADTRTKLLKFKSCPGGNFAKPDFISVSFIN